MSKIKVALAGVGNCASALIQGVYYYRDVEDEEAAIGLKNLYLGGYHPRDVEFVCAFDVAEGKVGRDLSEAIFSKPNRTLRFADVPRLDVKVQRGPLLDGLSGEALKILKVNGSIEVDVADNLRESGAEILINMLPSGAEEASRRYAEEALKAGCAYINVTPVRIAADRIWIGRFREKGLPIVGDDLADQVGATLIHRLLLETLSREGVKIKETYQLDVGGGIESIDTLVRTKELKREIKTRTVKSSLPYEAEVVAGSTDYVDFLENRRNSYFWIRGVYFGGAEMTMDIRLCTVDAPNAGSILLDVIRAVKVAIERGDSGNIHPISSYAFKNPVKILPPTEAEEAFEAYIKGVKCKV